jgi:hypothetical protein
LVVELSRGLLEWKRSAEVAANCSPAPGYGATSTACGAVKNFCCTQSWYPLTKLTPMVVMPLDFPITKSSSFRPALGPSAILV